MILLVAMAAIAVLILAGEIVVRRARAMDLPHFDADNAVGYIPKPSQSGRYRGRYDWCFNDHRLGVAERFDPSAGGILLAGDSIVFGEARMRQAERLGPVLRELTGRAVWPLSAPGWSIQNELVAMERAGDVVAGVRDIVLVLNSGDFTYATSWKSEAQQPTVTPGSLLLAFARRVWGRRFRPAIRPEFKVVKRDWQPMLASLRESTDARFLVVLYPERDEVSSGGERLDAVRRDLREVVGGAALIDVVADPRWSAELYVDEIHPSAAGARCLAGIIAEALEQQEAEASVAA